MLQLSQVSSRFYCQFCYNCTVPRNFIDPPAQTVKLGDSVVFKCESDDQDVKWTFRSYHLPDNAKQIKRLRRRGPFELKIFEVTAAKNAGSYVCISEKDFIISKGLAHLYVIDSTGIGLIAM